MPLVSKNFSDIITFTRASSATFTGSNGLIQSATTNTPRFDYDPVTLAAKGLLIEEQRTNLLTYSEEFDNAIWTKTRASITANTVVAPDGSLTGDKLVEDTTASSSHQIQFAATTIASSVHAGSFYAKAAERTWVLCQIGASSAGTAYFNLANGTVGTVTGGYTATITAVGNGWYRCTISGTIATSVASPFRIYLASDGATFQYTGDGTSGAFIWGAQLEAGSFATSYIPTVASQVTRSADAASVNTLSPWYNATEGTLFAEASVFGLLAAGNGIAGIADGTQNNRFGVYAVATNSAVGGYMRTGGTTMADLPVNSIAANAAIFKGAFAYKVNDFAFSANGGAALTDTSGTIATVDRLVIGGFYLAGQNLIQGHIRRITYYPRRLSNAELQAITA